MQAYLTALLVKIANSCRAVDVLVLYQAGVGASVRINQTVNTEVAVVGVFAVVAAVEVLGLAVFRLACVNGVVTEFPHKTAAHLVICLDELPVVFQISGAVAHGVGIFAHQKGLVGLGVNIVLQALYRGIHVAVQVYVAEVVLALAAAVLGAFVVGQACRVKVLGPCQRCFKATAVGTLVAHAPYEDAGAVFISLDTALSAVHGGFKKLGVICKGLVPVLHMVFPAVVLAAIELGCAVAFVVCLVNDHEAVLVAELIEHGGVGVVAGADGVEVVLLDYLQVALHVFNADDRPGNRVGVVAVYAAELDGAAVEEDLIVLYLYLSETDAVSDDLVLAFNKQGVEVRLLRIPEDGACNFHHQLVAVAAALKGFGLSRAEKLVLAVQN